MPTEIREHGIEVRIYPNDHRPPHVHAVKTGLQPRIEIGVPGEQAPRVIENEGLRASDLRHALAIVVRNQQRLLDRWREIHG